jgi:phosphotransferase system enzyme I (PtsI)
VLRLIAEVCAHGARTGRKVSLCGDAGGDPALVPMLLERGLRVVSAAPSQVASVKAAIAAVRLPEAPPS